MYNLPEAPDSRHTKGRGNGYVLSLGGKTVYISGDTEDIPEMRALKNIDVAFVCMNFLYYGYPTSIQCRSSIKPKIVYPYHYRGQGGLNDVEGFKQLVNAVNSSIDVRLRNCILSSFITLLLQFSPWLNNRAALGWPILKQ